MQEEEYEVVRFQNKMTKIEFKFSDCDIDYSSLYSFDGLACKEQILVLVRVLSLTVTISHSLAVSVALNHHQRRS